MSFFKYLYFVLIGSIGISCTTNPSETFISGIIAPESNFVRDTIISDTLIIFKTILKVENKEIVFENRFKNQKDQNKEDMFLLQNYLGLTVSNNNSQLKFLISFERENCRDTLGNYFAVFNPDSIDNPEGFNFKKIINDDFTYYILTGYFFGCNGSFCNSRCIIIIKFNAGRIDKGYLFGYDSMVFNPTVVDYKINKSNDLIVSFLYYTNKGHLKKKLSLLFDDKISIYGNDHLVPSEYGLFCIK